MKFTKKTDYALRTMQFLARNHKKTLGGTSGLTGPIHSVSVQFISQQSHLSLRFLHGIVSQLSKAKLLKTVSGPKGGISLARPPEKISILEIIEAVEGPINMMDCFDHPHQCADHIQCSIMGVLRTAQTALVNHLKNSNLSLMIHAQNDPFCGTHEKPLLKPQVGCPVLK
jgi:Rrf2 family protein